MHYGMNEHNLIQVECENNSTVNIKKKHTISIILPRHDSLVLSYFMPTICAEWA